MPAITPDEVEARQSHEIPEFVFEAFNVLIVKNWAGRQARVTQDEVVKAICANEHVTRNQIFEQGWLNVEAAFREAGWDVQYDKPGYNETYSAFFIFSRPSRPGRR